MNTFTTCLLVFSLFEFSCSIHLKYYVSDNKDVHFQNVSVVDVTQAAVREHITWLYVLGYHALDQQIEVFSDMPEMTTLRMYSIGQEIMPTFTDIPKLTDIDLSRNKITYIKREAIGKTIINTISFVGNQISTIESRSFGPKVQIAYLSCNKLTKFLPGWFQNTSSLEELDMTGNYITQLQENTFKKFINLQQIVLSHNKIKTIHSGAFANRNDLWTLYLGNNELMSLPTAAFAEGHVKISSLHLEDNRLSFLPLDFLEKTNQTKARIYGNPWQCACLDIIRAWNSWVNYEYNKEPEGAPRCVTPLSFQDNCIPYSDIESIEYYEMNAPKKQTRDDVCRSYFQ